MSIPSLEEYRSLSLLARFAVALRAAEGFCAAKALTGLRFTEFFDHLWELPAVESLPDWESHQNDLLTFGLGGALPSDVAPLLHSAGVPADLLRQLIEHCVEVVFGSFYAASDDTGSLSELAAVLSICQTAGITPPPAQIFCGSWFSDQHGWGLRISPEQRDRWRFSMY